MQEIKKNYYLEQYNNYRLSIVITDNIIKSRKKYDKDLGEFGDDYPEDTSIGGLHSYHPKSDSMYSYIFIDPTSPANSVPHEALHATFRITNLVGIQYCDHSEEAYCYLLGYIYDKILLTLNKWSDKYK